MLCTHSLCTMNIWYYMYTWVQILKVMTSFDDITVQSHFNILYGYPLQRRRMLGNAVSLTIMYCWKFTESWCNALWSSSRVLIVQCIPYVSGQGKLSMLLLFRCWVVILDCSAWYRLAWKLFQGLLWEAAAHMDLLFGWCQTDRYSVNTLNMLTVRHLLKAFWPNCVQWKNRGGWPF